MAVLPRVLGCSFGYAQDKLTLLRTIQVSLGFDLGFVLRTPTLRAGSRFRISDF